MKNILVLEDDAIQAVALRDLINKNIQNCNVVICNTEQEAREKSSAIDFHIMIIDLILESGSGLGFARWVRTIPKYQMVWIIIVTGNESFALEAIRQTHCFDYIIKPYQDYDILTILGKVIRSKVVKDANSNYLTIVTKGISFKIKLSEILFIEINNKNMDIHTTSKVYSVKRYPLSKIKEQLPKSMYIQCHRSYIVNSEKIMAVETRNRETYIMMTNHDKPIPVGIRYKGLISADNILDA